MERNDKYVIMVNYPGEKGWRNEYETDDIALLAWAKELIENATPGQPVWVVKLLEKREYADKSNTR